MRKYNFIKFITPSILFLLLLFSQYEQGVSIVKAWSGDSSENTPVDVNAKRQIAIKVLADKTGGAYVLYIDQVNSGMIYVQRLDKDGENIWGDEGIFIGRISSWVGAPLRLDMVEASSGGVIVVWGENRNNIPHVYAQHINTNGDQLWDEGGLLVSLETSIHALHPQVVSDDAGGVIVSWAYSNSSGNTKIKTQRINQNGLLMWEADGVELAGWKNRERYTKISPDGNGGAYILYRGSTKQVMMQHVDSGGNILWTPGGKLLADDSTSSISTYDLVPDNSKGVYIRWVLGPEIYYQRVNYDGLFLWGDEGIIFPFKGKMLSDGLGNLYIIAGVRVYPWDIDFYAHKILVDGSLGWEGNTVSIVQKPGAQFLSSFINSSDNSFIITWSDQNTQDGPTNSENPNEPSETDIYAQKIDTDGNILWDENGIVVSNAPSAQVGARVAQLDDTGYLFAWTDTRNGTNQDDIYAQRVNLDGTLGDAPTPTPTPTPKPCMLPNFGDVDGNPIMQTDPDWREKPYGGAMWEEESGEKKFIPFLMDDDNDGILDEDPENNKDDDGDGKIDEDTPETIGKWGCTITSATMVVNYFAKQQGVDKYFTPVDLNEWLSKNNGYKVYLKKPLQDEGGTKYVSDSVLNYEKVSEFALEEGINMSMGAINGILKDQENNVIETLDEFMARTRGLVDNSLCSLNPVLLAVTNNGWSHYVAASGKQKVGDIDTWRIHDPLSQSPTNMKDAYNGVYRQSIEYTDTLLDKKKAMQITAFSDPASLLLIDPLGKRIGYDPQTGNLVNEIPNASYGIEFLAAHDSTGSVQEYTSIYLSDYINGDYILRVIGNEDEDIGLEFYHIANGNSTINRASADIVKDGQITYTFSISEDGISEPTREISIKVDPFNRRDIIIYPIRGNRLLPVIIYSSATFDATSLNIRSVLLGPNQIPTIFKRGLVRDFNKDGYNDLRLYYRTKKVGIASNTTELCVEAEDENGQALRGCDDVTVMTLREFIKYLKSRLFLKHQM